MQIDFNNEQEFHDEVWNVQLEVDVNNATYKFEDDSLIVESGEVVLTDERFHEESQ